MLISCMTCKTGDNLEGLFFFPLESLISLWWLEIRLLKLVISWVIMQQCTRTCFKPPDPHLQRKDFTCLNSVAGVFLSQCHPLVFQFLPISGLHILIWKRAHIWDWKTRTCFSLSVLCYPDLTQNCYNDLHCMLSCCMAYNMLSVKWPWGTESVCVCVGGNWGNMFPDQFMIDWELHLKNEMTSSFWNSSTKHHYLFLVSSALCFKFEFQV